MIDEKKFYEETNHMIDARDIYRYIKMMINPYGKPFEGTIFEFGNKLMDYIIRMEKQPKVNCSDCSRRQFYQKGYQEGLNANKWIPCSERLPECDGIYQLKNYEVTKLINGHLVVTTATYDFGEFNNWLIHKSHKVIAWRELPEPYIGDEE